MLFLGFEPGTAGEEGLRSPFVNKVEIKDDKFILHFLPFKMRCDHYNVTRFVDISPLYKIDPDNFLVIVNSTFKN